MPTSCRFLLAALIVSGLVACRHVQEDSETRPLGVNVLPQEELRHALRGQVSFARHVKPVLEAKCLACHQNEAMPGRLSLESREAALRSGMLGIFILPGQPQHSRFLHNLAEAHAGVKSMPPVGETLTDEEETLLRRWIAQGAEWPAGMAGRLRTPF
jgi:uncharacterized membrane protein